MNSWVAYGAAALAAMVAAYFGWQEIRISRLQADIAQYETTIASQDHQIKSLLSSVDSQNTAVERWRLAAEQRASDAEAAQRAARLARRQADEAIGRLQAREARTCEEGIELIDEALGL